jgi:integrase
MAKKRGNNEGSISRRPDGRWMAQVTLGRDPTTGTLKRATFYGKTRQEAAGKLTQALQDAAQGTFVPPHRLTLGAWLATWLWEYKRPKLKAITFDSYAMLLRKHIKPALGHLPLRDVRPEQLQRFYNTLGAQGYSARTIRYCHTLLHGALQQAQKNSLIVRNVATLVELPRAVKKEMQTLSLAQVAGTLLPHVAGHPLEAAFVLVFTTGLRRGEVLALRWSDVDLERGVLHVRRTLVRARGSMGERSKLIVSAPKTAQAQRTIPLPAQCVTALRRHRAHQAADKLRLGVAYADQGLVVCQANGRPLDPRNFNRQFSRMLAQAGLPHIRLHDSRHTYATLLLEQRVPHKTVQVLLGHASAKTTLDIYSHVSLELEHQADRTLDAALGGGGN